ncbi:MULTISPECIES: DUF5908 family protein [Burkholderiaceae]|uniref:DUF5908 family protein n=1 Tax=Burkholderiaceae TaxID=119060 RepID=UPI0009630B2B|nr:MULTISPECIES: DUF5908 family protein [Burkholderiaceae]MCG1018215.1 hypothetical protein [Mycetohabitans sp. B4]SIT67031.1 hypothetical protein SAMN04487768_1039 [Burkholderia sp. b13]
MTIEIRELVIEARVVSESPTPCNPTTALPMRSEQEWVEQVARRALELLNEQREQL